VPAQDSPVWLPLLDRVRLRPDTRHSYDLAETEPVTWVRLDAFPDGGISRVRLIGAIDRDARRMAGYRWFNSLPASQVVECLADAGLSAELAASMAARRPLSERWLSEKAKSADAAGIAILAGMLEGRRP